MIHPSLSKPVAVSAAIVDALAEAGVRYVFGMPGGYTGELFSALYEHPTIQVIQVREESIGSVMAEAYGRLTGRPAVVMGQGEWIAGNAGQGFLEALLGASPVLILTEMSDGGSLSHHGYYQAGTGDYGAWDAHGALRGVTKRVMVSHDPVQAVQHTQLALKHALTGEPGPVAVVFHGNALRGEVGPDSLPRIYPTSAYLPRRSRSVDGDVLRSAAAAVRDAQRPVVVAGNGVRVGQAWDNLARFAERADVAVVTTAAGKGTFAEVDPRAGGVMGTFGVPAANTLVAEADVVIAVGTKLAPIDTGDENPALLDPSRQTLIQIDIEPLNASWTFPMDHTLVGDAGYLLDCLSDECRSPSRALSAEGRVAAARQAHRPRLDPEAQRDEIPLSPQRVIELLQQRLPQDAVITCDAGENRLFMMHYYRTRLANSYLQPAAGGGMGYAVPAAMGAKVAYPERPVLAVCGDGGFAMSVHALMTAVQARLPIAVVVFNNNALGWVLHGMGERAVAAGFAPFDYAAVARAAGCAGFRPNNVEDLAKAVDSAWAHERPCVIDVSLSLSTSFKDIVQPISGGRWRKGE